MIKQKLGRDKKIFLTWACPRICMNNSYLFEIIRNFYVVNHYPLTGEIEKSDIIVVNTCGYTDETADENVRFIDRIKKEYPEKKIIVFGCLTKISEVIKEDNSLTLIGPKAIHKFSDLFDNSVKCGDPSYLPFVCPPNTPEMVDETNRGFIQIAQGCINNCSYCNIKIAKGSVKSKPIKVIKAEAFALAKYGVGEITLLADDCGSYGHDIDTNIAELTSNILLGDEKQTIKIYTIFAGLFLKYYPALSPFYFNGRITYTCLPLQSGSRRILKLMNRNYNLNKIKHAVREIKEKNPRTRLFTHFIINFPTETIDDFKLSLDLASLFDYTLFLPYGENSRTAASTILEKCSQRVLMIKIGLAKEAIERGFLNGLVVHEL
jgi:threonylcarbamoyladenosine tRNA methylthiotransferase CDKAL1